MTGLRPLSVLIVEDEGLIAMDIEMTIEDEGHAVAGWARSADEAIEMFEASSPDIVFLDVQLLNGTSGIDVAKNLRDRTGAKYVFMTANPKLLDETLVGGIGVFEKPFTQSRLVDVLRFLHKAIQDPPPTNDVPVGLRLGAVYQGIWS